MSDDRSDPPAADHPRRPSPFDDGFVTLWTRGDGPAGRPEPVSDHYDRVGAAPAPAGTTDDDLPVGEVAGDPGDEPPDIAIEVLAEEDAIAERNAAQAALRPVLRSLEAVGLYAYITLDDENQWTVASDDEAGRVDVRLHRGDFEVVMAATSTGMYADEDNAYRRKSLERLARMLIPRVARGHLAEHQSATWDEVEAGASVRVRYVLPRDHPEAIGPFVREHFAELEELLGFIETEISR